MGERLKAFRKALGLNQADFGARIGVTNPAISKLEKGERNFTDQMILAICREFNVNEGWLRYGQEPMLVEPRTFSLDAYALQNDLAPVEIDLIKRYMSLDKGMRETLIALFKNH